MIEYLDLLRPVLEHVKFKAGRTGKVLESGASFANPIGDYVTVVLATH